MARKPGGGAGKGPRGNWSSSDNIDRDWSRAIREHSRRISPGWGPIRRLRRKERIGNIPVK